MHSISSVMTVDVAIPEYHILFATVQSVKKTGRFFLFLIQNEQCLVEGDSYFPKNFRMILAMVF